ncbi:hypothetical protein MOBT1_002974 [Malassezia obtusa]|uniref:Mitochondrial inner membrane protease subunit n=1 Tax=Malassezia obtusa TaxID=76774 RepID=A0AAF0E2A0_9BASI|nr:hypothetical protein MOBT1_002974 [Malassezia obtusa]
MAWANARQWAGQATRLSVFTVQMMCVVHLVNQHIFEVRMVRAFSHVQCKGASMLPTLSPAGDLVLHLRLPFLRMLAELPFADPELKSRFPSVPKGLPSAKLDPSMGLGLKLGDMVVATSPADPSRTVCKRILGMGGDTILVDPRDVASGLTDAAVAHHELARHLEGPHGLHHTKRIVTIPKGHVWLAGDNLANSTDSRHYGPVPLALVKGRVVARLYPRPQWLHNPLQFL